MGTDYEQERLRILEMIENGAISAGDGVRLLNALQGSASEPVLDASSVVSEQISAAPPAPESAENQDGGGATATEPSVEDLHEDPAMHSTPDIDPDMLKWRKFWWIPMGIGIGITVISAFFIYLAYLNGGFSFWFACLWFPFMLGLVIMVLAAGSRTARWLHVRVQQPSGEWPRNIIISLPLPIRLTAWFLRTFGHYIPHMDVPGLDNMILALEKTSPDAPFYVEVDEGEGGERVEVYIG